MLRNATTLLLFIHSATGGAVSGPGPGKASLITAEELAPRVGKVTIVDAREKKEFERGHVPGSLSMEWKEWTAERPGLLNAVLGDPASWGKVASPDDAQAKLRALGLANGKPVVVVGNPEAWGEEGRIAWNLLYWGADDVALLDGGYPAWAARPERPVEKGPAKPPARAGDFTVRVRPERRADASDVEAAMTTKARAILDARSSEEFTGKRVPGQKRGGHVPGARLVPKAALYETSGRYVGADALRALVGPTDGGRPIAYCTGGVRSALLALLAEIRLGVLTANYDGSMWEWSADRTRPLAQ